MDDEAGPEDQAVLSTMKQKMVAITKPPTKEYTTLSNLGKHKQERVSQWHTHVYMPITQENKAGESSIPCQPEQCT